MTGQRVVPLLALSLVLLVLLVASVFSPPAPSRRLANGDSPPFLTPALSPHPVGSGWLTYLGSENRTGFAATSGPSGPNNTLWSSVDHSPGISIRTSLVVNATRVYFADGIGTVYALDRENNGTILWSHDVGGTLTTPDLSSLGLVVGSSDGIVTDLNPVNGSVAWNASTGAPVVGGITVFGGSVYVSSGASVVALSLASGQILWRTVLPSPAAGSTAYDGGRVFATTRSGLVVALSTSGGILWSHNIGAPIASAPAVEFGDVIIADLGTNVTALAEVNGSLLWHFSGRPYGIGDAFNSTPAVGGGRVFAETNLAQFVALSLSNGALVWNRTGTYTGAMVLTSPVVTATSVYAVLSGKAVDSFDPGTGALRWQLILQGATYASPAVDRGDLFVADELGVVTDLGAKPVVLKFPVTGTVVNGTGAPMSGVSVQASDPEQSVAVTGIDGTFALNLPTGTYTLSASFVGFLPAQRSVLVLGPVTGVTLELRPVPFFLLTGFVEDSHSGHRLPGALLAVFGPYGTSATTRSNSTGSFALAVPSGNDLIIVTDPPHYATGLLPLTVAGAPVFGVVVSMEPTGLGFTGLEPAVTLVLALAGVSASLMVFAGYWRVRQRTEHGLSPTILSAFARFVAMRLLLIPGQVVGLLLLLYVFGTFLPAAAKGTDPCVLAAAACAGCSWSNFACVISAFGQGFGRFAFDLFTGVWGTATYANITEPATLFLTWWLPDSLELAIVALLLSAAIAYPVGLIAGWRREGAFDTAVRLSSLAGLLLPSFLLALIILGVANAGFNSLLGDGPFGTLPSLLWFQTHGGVPDWIGVAYTTTPTRFPLIDGMLHQAWTFEAVVLAKTFIQALAISVIYVAIFLRYARHAAAEAAEEPYIVAAKARGVNDQAILWRHLGRRVLPLYLLIFGITLPMYIGTQALVEALAQANGLGTLLLIEITNFSRSGFGLTPAAGGQILLGNFYQVMIFILLLLVLVGNLLTDVLARYYDPRIIRSEGG